MKIFYLFLIFQIFLAKSMTKINLTDEKIQLKSNTEDFSVFDWFLDLPEQFNKSITRIPKNIKYFKNLILKKPIEGISKIFIKMIGESNLDSFLISLKIFVAILLSIFFTDRNDIKGGKFKIVPEINKFVCIGIFFNILIFFSISQLNNLEKVIYIPIDEKIETKNSFFSYIVNLGSYIMFSSAEISYFVYLKENFVALSFFCNIKNICKTIIQSICFIFLFFTLSPLLNDVPGNLQKIPISLLIIFISKFIVSKIDILEIEIQEELEFIGTLKENFSLSNIKSIFNLSMSNKGLFFVGFKKMVEKEEKSAIKLLKIIFEKDLKSFKDLLDFKLNQGIVPLRGVNEYTMNFRDYLAETILNSTDKVDSFCSKISGNFQKVKKLFKPVKSEFLSIGTSIDFV